MYVEEEERVSPIDARRTGGIFIAYCNFGCTTAHYYTTFFARLLKIVLAGYSVHSRIVRSYCRGVASIEAEEAVASSLFADLVVRTNPPSSLQYQLFLRVELILDCKHSKNSLAAGARIAGRRAGRRAMRRVETPLV